MTDSPDLPPGLALAWGVAPEPTRGPKRELSVDRIVAEAVALADARGLDAVSMNAVARACGVTTMALYRYLPSKDDLVMLMGEAAISAPPAHHPERGWRETITAWALRHVDALLAHPWLLDAPLRQAPTTPRSVEWAEAGLAAFDGTGLAVEEKLAIILEVNAHCRLRGALLRQWGDGPSAYDTGVPAAAVALIDSERFPRYASAMAAEPDPPTGPELDMLSFGLDVLLDGVELRIAERQQQS